MSKKYSANILNLKKAPKKEVKFAITDSLMKDY